MSDALLSDDIKLWLSEHARSHFNAKPRRLLLTAKMKEWEAK